MFSCERIDSQISGSMHNVKKSCTNTKDYSRVCNGSNMFVTLPLQPNTVAHRAVSECRLIALNLQNQAFPVEIACTRMNYCYVGTKTFTDQSIKQLRVGAQSANDVYISIHAHLRIQHGSLC